MPLAVVRPPVDPEIVETLREALARAERGETQALFMLEIDGDTQIKTTSRIGRRDTIIYALEYAKHRTLQEAIDGI